MFKKLILLISIFSSGKLFAASDYFDELWQKIVNEHHAIKAIQEKSKGTNEEYKKASRHWLPEIYTGGATYFTNDAGANLFGLLSQKQIGQMDFVPETLNNPSMNHYTKLSLGLDLPLYQGGAGNNYLKLTSYLSEADKIQIRGVRMQLLQEFMGVLENIQMAERYLVYYFEKQKELEKLKSNYQIGQKENLLGYSGKLGMDNLSLKMSSQVDYLKTKQKNFLFALEEMVKSKIDIEEVKKIKLNEKWANLTAKETFKVRAETQMIENQAKAMEVGIDLSKARLRPQVSFFADQSFFRGDRDTADAQTVGISLKWSLFSSENLSTESKALYQFYATKNMHLAKVEEDKIQLEGLNNYDSTLDELIKKAKVSKNILKEQSVVTYKLFKNGLINILQHLEVFNQDLELNAKLLELEGQKLEIQTKKLLYSNN